jgi:hypothetical protein
MAPPLAILTNFKHKVFFSNHVLTNPYNVANTSIKLDVVVIVETQAKVDLANNKKRKKMYELNCCF